MRIIFLFIFLIGCSTKPVKTPSVFERAERFEPTNSESDKSSLKEAFKRHRNSPDHFDLSEAIP